MHDLGEGQATLTVEVPQAVLNTGQSIPQLGVGAFLLPPNQTEPLMSAALEIGYRHIDTATLYKNEAEIGRAVKSSQIARSDLYLTTKLGNPDQGFQSTHDSFERSLDALQTDYIDLYLMHWPAPGRGLYEETWAAMVEIFESGRAKSIGVCNFEPEHIDRILPQGVVPAVNQVELHPAFHQKKLRAYLDSHGILIQAWGPLGQNKYDLHDLPHLGEIAKKHGRSVHQVTLRWHIQSGNIIFPKTVRVERLRENFEIFDFELDQEDMAKFEVLDVNLRIGNNPYFRN